MARYIKANPKVAKFLNLESDRNTVKDGNYADCFSEEDKCSKKGEEESYCDSENYSHDAFVSYVCSEMSDGSLRNVMSDGYYCLNEDETDYTSCNAAGTACE